MYRFRDPGVDMTDRDLDLGVVTSFFCRFGVRSTSESTSLAATYASVDDSRVFLRDLVAFVCVLMKSDNSYTSSLPPPYTSSQTNSSVYVAVLVLQPRRQKKVLELRGTLPEGYFFMKAS